MLRDSRLIPLRRRLTPYQLILAQNVDSFHQNRRRVCSKPAMWPKSASSRRAWRESARWRGRATQHRGGARSHGCGAPHHGMAAQHAEKAPALRHIAQVFGRICGSVRQYSWSWVYPHRPTSRPPDPVVLCAARAPPPVLDIGSSSKAFRGIAAITGPIRIRG